MSISNQKRGGEREKESRRREKEILADISRVLLFGDALCRHNNLYNLPSWIRTTRLYDITVPQIAHNHRPSGNSFDLNHIRESSWIVAKTRMLFGYVNIEHTCTYIQYPVYNCHLCWHRYRRKPSRLSIFPIYVDIPRKCNRQSRYKRQNGNNVRRISMMQLMHSLGSSNALEFEFYGTRVIVTTDSKFIGALKSDIRVFYRAWIRKLLA